MSPPEQNSDWKRIRNLFLRIAIGRRPWITLARLAFLLAVVAMGAFYLFPGGQTRFKRIEVHGSSMEPTFISGQVLWVNQFAFTDSTPSRGDVVLLGNPKGGSLYLKRVVALPGESIAIRQGRVWVEGNALNEPYARGQIPAVMPKTGLARDEFLVLGDNRSISAGGMVTLDNIKGKIM